MYEFVCSGRVPASRSTAFPGWTQANEGTRSESVDEAVGVTDITDFSGGQ